jgi:DNA-binding transcriptional LysR family regulator
VTAAGSNLHAELSRAYARIAALTRQLDDEQALTRRLRVVIALGDLASPAIKRYMRPPRRKGRGRD